MTRPTPLGEGEGVAEVCPGGQSAFSKRRRPFYECIVCMFNDRVVLDTGWIAKLAENLQLVVRDVHQERRRHRQHRGEPGHHVRGTG